MSSRGKTRSKSSDESTLITKPVKDNGLGVPDDYQFKFEPKSSKLSTSGEEKENSDSSSEGFEHINITEATTVLQKNDVPATNSSPNSPAKLTSQKRSAQAAHGSASDVSEGSAPSSPLVKRKKWQDFLKEDDEKKGKIKEKETTPSTPEELTGPRISFSRNVWLFLPVISVVVAVTAYYFLYGTESITQPESTPAAVIKNKNIPWKKINKNFFSEIESLKQEFPNQKRETWINLVSTISDTLKKTEPVHPAVISAFFPPTVNAAFASCFITKIGQAVNKAIAPIYGTDASTGALMTASPTTFETSSITEFRNNLEEYFKKKGKVLVTHDIDKFSTEEHLYVFHGLCDNFHAVDKRATLLFPIPVPTSIFGKYDWVHERGGDIGTEVLSEAWKKVLTPDTAPAMVVRIAESVILLNAGDTCNLE